MRAALPWPAPHPGPLLEGEGESVKISHTAAAPPTISEISWVMAAWRALL